MIETSIIIPTHNNWQCIKKCLDAVLANTENYELIFVIDGSVEFAEELKNYGQVIKTGKPFIFAHRVNLGIKAARGEYICILNDDTVPHLRWLEMMIEAVNEYNNSCIVGPRCNKGGCSNPDAISCNEYYRKETHFTLNMYCLLIPRRILDVVGLLDERFCFYGGEDDDYTLRVRRHNFGTIISEGYVEHDHTSGRKENASELLKKTAEIFKDKWGVYMPRKFPDEHWNDDVRFPFTKPLISILMPTRNHSKYIGAAIESCLRQSYGNYELLIGIDGGDENEQNETLKIIDRCGDARIRVYQSTHMGSCNMRNMLFKIASGEFIVLMDSDDYMLPCRLQRQLIDICCDDIVYSVYNVNDADENFVCALGKPITPQILCNSDEYIAGGTFFMRRYVLERAKFDEKFARAFDLEFFLRNYENFKFKFSAEPAIVYRCHRGEHLSEGEESRRQHKELKEKYNKGMKIYA